MNIEEGTVGGSGKTMVTSMLSDVVGQRICYTGTYCLHMNRFLVGLLVVVGWLPSVVTAEVFTNRPLTPYELLPMLVPDSTGEYLGTLRDEPVTYELSVASTTDLQFTLTQPKAEQPAALGLLIVRALPNGKVELVSRISATNDAGWREEPDHWLGMSWWALPAHTVTLVPGMYRVEVSSPVNVGPFRLVVGEQSGWRGYREVWQRIATINDFYDRPWVMWLDSWFVLLHILGVAVLYGLLRRVGWWWPRLVAFVQWCTRICSRMYAYSRRYINR